MITQKNQVLIEKSQALKLLFRLFFCLKAMWIKAPIFCPQFKIHRLFLSFFHIQQGVENKINMLVHNFCISDVSK